MTTPSIAVIQVIWEKSLIDWLQPCSRTRLVNCKSVGFWMRYHILTKQVNQSLGSLLVELLKSTYCLFYSSLSNMFVCALPCMYTKVAESQSFSFYLLFFLYLHAIMKGPMFIYSFFVAGLTGKVQLVVCTIKLRRRASAGSSDLPSCRNNIGLLTDSIYFPTIRNNQSKKSELSWTYPLKTEWINYMPSTWTKSLYYDS